MSPQKETFFFNFKLWILCVSLAADFPSGHQIQDDGEERDGHHGGGSGEQGQAGGDAPDRDELHLALRALLLHPFFGAFNP